MKQKKLPVIDKEVAIKSIKFLIPGVIIMSLFHTFRFYNDKLPVTINLTELVYFYSTSIIVAYIIVYIYFLIVKHKPK